MPYNWIHNGIKAAFIKNINNRKVQHRHCLLWIQCRELGHFSPCTPPTPCAVTPQYQIKREWNVGMGCCECQTHSYSNELLPLTSCVGCCSFYHYTQLHLFGVCTQENCLEADTRTSTDTCVNTYEHIASLLVKVWLFFLCALYPIVIHKGCV